MSAQEILEEMPKLSREDLQLIRNKLDEVLIENGAKTEETLSDALLKWAGQAKGLPPDLAQNHDHYLHGTPKQ